ncbi:hypothetical protein Sango_0939400 [Sesamum angolense]|uniref:Coiled-coil domain-containing protein 47 n=1 Tax=Sesamum angolense TaxID=2727404 RepID=A0AAE2BY28_9LAMI|nr:hypothetical protein Sango_0939400 [Sesamum angolense]
MAKRFFLSLFLIAILSLFLHHLSASSHARPHFEGFDADDDDDDFSIPDPKPDAVVPPLRSTPPSISLSTSTPESHHPASPSSLDYWDEDEFEGIPHLNSPPVTRVLDESAATVSESDAGSGAKNSEEDPRSNARFPKKLTSYWVEVVCVPFLVLFTINYFMGKWENENIALAWATKFAAKDSIFDKNFSLLGVGETEDSPLLLKEGQNVFRFYASGRRFCSGLLATMVLKSRHDLISSEEEIGKDDAQGGKDLQRFAALVTPPSGRKWVAEELQVVSESKEVAGDLITDVVLDQLSRNLEKDSSQCISDQHLGSNKKMLVFKFAIPDANNMADMTRLVALIPYYIDLIGRYKLSSHVKAARLKVAQEIYKELQNARQEALQKKKAEQKKKLDEAESKLSAEALRKREAKERARQMKKGMPKLKMTRAH